MAQTLTLPPLVRGRWIPMTSEEFDAWISDDVRAKLSQMRTVDSTPTCCRVSG
jgi:hypothetical protein